MQPLTGQYKQTTNVMIPTEYRTLNTAFRLTFGSRIMLTIRRCALKSTRKLQRGGWKIVTMVSPWKSTQAPGFQRSPVGQPAVIMITAWMDQIQVVQL